MEDIKRIGPAHVFDLLMCCMTHNQMEGARFNYDLEYHHEYYANNDFTYYGIVVKVTKCQSRAGYWHTTEHVNVQHFETSEVKELLNIIKMIAEDKEVVPCES